MNSYKYLDVGCKSGGSFTTVSKRFGFSPKQGLGMDINPNHVDKFIKLGYHGIVGDAANIPFLDNTFELIILSHVLEHMADEQTGYNVIKECIRVSSKKVFICLPFFDEDEYLRTLKLKTFYSDWTGHKNLVHLKSIIDFLGSISYEVTMKKKIENSFASEILPITAPKNSLEYNQELHGLKEYVEFDRNIWREYDIVITK
jgi:ubiquinone/menaquinone biosynthesis C-methylase UbiE